MSTATRMLPRDRGLEELEPLMFISAVTSVRPVMFAPGRARLFTTPPLTGSPTAPITTGIVFVACFAARAAGMPRP